MEEHYGPEDIEQLLLDKEFSELLPEEKTYVLKHIKGESEYENMREMLLEITSPDEEVILQPTMRDELISTHEKYHERPSFRVWLNSLFASLSFELKWPRPILQLTVVAALIIGSVWVFMEVTRSSSNEKFALEPQAIENPKESDKSDVLEEEKQVSDKGSISEYNNEKETLEEPAVDISGTMIEKNIQEVENKDESFSHYDPKSIGLDVHSTNEIEVVKEEIKEKAQFNTDQAFDDDLEEEAEDFSISSERGLEQTMDISSISTGEIEIETRSSKAIQNTAVTEITAENSVEIITEQEPINPDILALMYTAW